jgi:predicted DsbA family dithiol-disulfide isomerase
MGTIKSENCNPATIVGYDRQDIGQIDVLTSLEGEVRLDQQEFKLDLRTRKFQQVHQRALRHAYEEAGVPMFVIGDQGLTGLQDRERLEAVIEEELARQTARR